MPGQVTHGDTIGQVFALEYNSWAHMHGRCSNPNNARYDRYGGRGITVCERWNSYENFLADMGRRPGPEYSIDRIDNDGNYEPGNCRWATPAEQAHNRPLGCPPGCQCKRHERTNEKCVPGCTCKRHILGFKGNHDVLRGEYAPSAVLTSSQVYQIRVRFAAGATAASLGDEFSVSRRAIGKIVNGQTWRDVGGPIRSKARVGRRSNSEIVGQR